MYTDKIANFIYNVFICDRSYSVDGIYLEWLIRMIFIWSFLILIAPFGFIAELCNWVFTMFMSMSILTAISNSFNISVSSLSLGKRIWLFLTKSPLRAHILWAVASSIMASVICTEVGFMFMEIPINSRMAGVPFEMVIGSYATLFFSAFAITFAYWNLLAKPLKGVNYAT